MDYTLSVTMEALVVPVHLVYAQIGSGMVSQQNWFWNKVIYIVMRQYQ